MYTYAGSRAGGAYYCQSLDDLRGDPDDYIALSVPGSVPIPAALRRSSACGGTSVTVGQHTSVEAGHAYMHLNANGYHLRERVYDGYYTHTLRWKGLGAASTSPSTSVPTPMQGYAITR